MELSQLEDHEIVMQFKSNLDQKLFSELVRRYHENIVSEMLSLPQG